MKVRIQKGAATFFYYPDATVDCSDPAGSSHFLDEPCAIFEVLSPQTERIDRGEKLRNYQEIASLGVYVLVDQLRLAVTVYRRANDEWTIELLTGKQDVLEIPSIGYALPITAIYERARVLR